ncbi:Cytosine/adenosine deaminase [Chishuiella changwenlii]|jgi:cytosine/adenosine deaminase-related metal-dependent hydrolase|uniref:Deaminase n=1 Tax=Chishuiella changwenlii TaxID=1434701 RepID=A0A1M6T1S6_9FLAO|nr:amidohydrolase [Chishuiella changwenlii]GGE94546.1 deaminase [Chishuiella changwenlii]SHK50748.1 Cytosine/adenosine deaminase [Chishuiella changwenlii]
METKNSQHIDRKTFIKMSSLFGVGLLTASTQQLFAMEKIENMETLKNITQIKNVRLEIGFERDDFEITGTKTALFNLDIKNGKIVKIHQENPLKDAFDAKGFLLLPAMKDMHIHLDKTFYGGPWKARSKRQHSVADMIKLEQELMPELLKVSVERAGKIIELLQSHGTNFARSHCNIETTSKLDSLKNLQKAIEQKKDNFNVEIVAFPQHGLYYTESLAIMKEAAKMNIDFIGGLDPTSIDGNMERTMDDTIQMALDNKKGIDIHLHETGESGLKTFEYLIDKVNENPVLKGKTFMSHAFVLAKLDAKKQEEIAEKLADAKIGIISTIPFGRTIMPIPTLIKKGVYVATGTDSVIDHWQPFGLGNMLQRANVMAELYGMSDEFGLSRCLKIATNQITPLDDNGNVAWPKVGDEASFNLIAASCSAEAVARISPLVAHFDKGVLI